MGRVPTGEGSVWLGVVSTVDVFYSSAPLVHSMLIISCIYIVFPKLQHNTNRNPLYM